MRVAICPGHTIKSKGLRKHGIIEHTECKLIAEKVVEQLQSEGHTVSLIEGSLLEKIQIINDGSYDLAIEIHLESNENKNIRGASSYYMMKNVEARRLAESLSSSCALYLKSINIGPRIGWFNKVSPKDKPSEEGNKPKIDLFLSKINCTSTIISPFHISNKYEVTKYQNLGPELVAKAIVHGITNYESLRNLQLEDSQKEEVVDEQSS